MNFTNEVIKEMEEKQYFNRIFKGWYYGMSEEYQDIKYLKRSDRIGSCLDYWHWDKYTENKILDLKSINRCMNNRFCPNCKKWDLAIAIHNFKPIFEDFVYRKNYYPYLVTLTVPNCTGDNLKDTIDKINKSFYKLYGLLSKSLEGRKGFKGRLMKFNSALKVLEITYNSENNTFHPHLHCIFFSEEYEEQLFIKYIPGAYSKKKNDILYNSDMDIHLMQLWKMCYDNIRITNKNYENMSRNWFDLYQVDIRELDPKGIYEVMKYTFKDTDVKSYYVFKTFVNALEGKRIRQGYGELYNLKLEYDSEGEKLDLEEFITKKETPQEIYTRELKELYITYEDYTKISRFRKIQEINNLD